MADKSERADFLGEPARLVVRRPSMECLELHKFQKLTQPRLLMTAQPLWFDEHAFDHFSRLMPVAINTCLHECFAGPRTGAVRGYDVSDDWSELINDLHGATSFNIYDPYPTAELASGSGNLRLRQLRPHWQCKRSVHPCVELISALQGGSEGFPRLNNKSPTSTISAAATSMLIICTRWPFVAVAIMRSEERRVGKECRARRAK